MPNTTDIADLYVAYRQSHGITARTHWVIGQGIFHTVRHLRDGAGQYLYCDVITPTTNHHTLMGLAFEVSDTDAEALYLTER